VQDFVKVVTPAETLALIYHFRIKVKCNAESTNICCITIILQFISNNKEKYQF
jgi:hypothetical protein